MSQISIDLAIYKIIYHKHMKNMGGLLLHKSDLRIINSNILVLPLLKVLVTVRIKRQSHRELGRASNLSE